MNINKTLKIRVFASFAVAVLLSLSLRTYVNAADSYLSIGLTKYSGVQSFQIESSAISVYGDVYEQPLLSFESPSGFTVSLTGAGVTVSSGGDSLFTAASPLIQGADGLTKIGGVSYRGFIKPVNAQSGIGVVNVVLAEEYLYGVVPAEMPALWSIEALKAQAVAARSYLRFNAGLHAGDGYDVCDTTHCQVYGGTSMEHPSSTSAVNQTAGVMAYYNGMPINAVYSSSSGGHTENSENVWSETVPYMRGVKEVAEKEFLQWSRTYTLSQISNGLAARGANIGTVHSVTAEYFPSGRVARLIFNGSNGSKSYEKDIIRSFTSAIDSSLPSSLFKINGYGWSQSGVWEAGASQAAGAGASYVTGAEGAVSPTPSEAYVAGAEGAVSKLSAETVSVVNGDGSVKTYSLSGGIVGGGDSSAASGTNTFTITSGVIALEGRGNGHGVGMSQYGAKGMAEAGYDYISILKHYYAGIDVR